MKGLLRVLCFGGRDYTDYAAISSALQTFDPLYPQGWLLIHGGARGTDKLCGRWAWLKGKPVVCVDANWDYYGYGAGPIRNDWMLELQPQYGIQFPGGNGTRDMREKLDAANITVWEPYK